MVKQRDSIPEIGADEFPGTIPVELASFTANAINGKVRLSWITATETNNFGFDVEKITTVTLKRFTLSLVKELLPNDSLIHSLMKILVMEKFITD